MNNCNWKLLRLSNDLETRLGTIDVNSTPHASPGNGVANQAESFSSFKPSLTYNDGLVPSVGAGTPEKGCVHRLESSVTTLRRQEMATWTP